MRAWSTLLLPLALWGCAGTTPRPSVTAAVSPMEGTRSPSDTAGTAPVPAELRPGGPTKEIRVASIETSETQAKQVADATSRAADPLTSPPTFPDRQSVEALDRLASTVTVEHGKRGSVILLPSDDYFDAGSAALNQAARWRLENIARALAAQSRRTMTIRAHTDSLGDRAEAIRLSFARAVALRDYFVEMGVPPDGLRAEGLGPEHPVADNRTPSGRAANRRIEIAIEVNPDPLARR